MKELLRWVGATQLLMVPLSVFIFYTIALVAAPLEPVDVRGVGLSALIGSGFGFGWAALLLSAALLRKDER